MIERSNRNGHRFACKFCGYVGNADQVASLNIRQVYLNTLTDGPSVNSPLIVPLLAEPKVDGLNCQ